MHDECQGSVLGSLHTERPHDECQGSVSARGSPHTERPHDECQGSVLGSLHTERPHDECQGSVSACGSLHTERPHDECQGSVLGVHASGGASSPLRAWGRGCSDCEACSLQLHTICEDPHYNYYNKLEVSLHASNEVCIRKHGRN